jgi:HK97 family phage major capsid protein
MGGVVNVEVAGRTYRSVAQMREREDEILRLAHSGSLSDSEHARLNDEWADLTAARLEAEDGGGRARDRVRSAARSPRNREAGASFGNGGTTTADDGPFGEARERGLRAIERMADHLSADAGDRLDDVVRRDRSGLDARYIDAVSNPEYERAFWKRVMRPDTAQFEMTAAEAEAMRTVAQVELERAMSVGTTTAGGFGVPFALDPTIVLSSDGSVNPLRELATVTPITTNEWKGVTSEGVTAGPALEASEVGDDTPELAQPSAKVHRFDAFVPFSFEVGMDYPSFQQELATLFSDAKDNAEATSFTTGDGNAPNPQGIITGTTGIYTTAGTAAFVVADVYGVKQAVPPRFSPNASWVSAAPIADLVYRMVGGGSTEPPLFNEDRTMILGKGYRELSAMDSSVATGNEILLYGDIEQGFRILDRIGMSIELVQHLFATANNRPSGQRGLLAWWRTGSVVQVPNALRVLRVL